jgi:P27 family predicted phage terminase small subunit
VQKYGEMLISKKTEQPYQSPYLNMMTAAAKQMVSFAAELGMTPAGKARVKASDAGKTDRADDKADLLRFVG